MVYKIAEGTPESSVGLSIPSWDRWKAYSMEKRILDTKNLTPVEYDEEIQKLVAKLGI